MDRNKDGVLGVFWKCARIGERLSPYVSLCCILMAVSEIFKFHTCPEFLKRCCRQKGRAETKRERGFVNSC
jgi:hypothetical protein